MPNPTPVLDPIADGPATGRGRWMVVIFNNDHNSFDEVILALVGATGCTLEEASLEAWEAHTYGQAPVHFSDQDECEMVAEQIARIGVQTEVRPEWTD